MIRRFAMPLAVLALSVAITACGGSSDSSVSPGTGPSPTPSPSPSPSPPPASASCNAVVTGVPASVPAATGHYPFAITIGTGCSWTARTDVSWADVAPGSGSGNFTAMLNVNQNASVTTRTFSVIVNSQSFQTTQASVCTYSVDPTSLDEGAGGGTASVRLTTVAGCPWTATASESWIRVVTPSGTGSATVLLELAPINADVRHAFVTIAGLRVDVMQRRTSVN
jgi:hypothetical protein